MKYTLALLALLVLLVTPFSASAAHLSSQELKDCPNVLVERHVSITIDNKEMSDQSIDRL